VENSGTSLCSTEEEELLKRWEAGCLNCRLLQPFALLSRYGAVNNRSEELSSSRYDEEEEEQVERLKCKVLRSHKI